MQYTKEYGKEKCASCHRLFEVIYVTETGKETTTSIFYNDKFVLRHLQEVEICEYDSSLLCSPYCTFFNGERICCKFHYELWNHDCNVDGAYNECLNFNWRYCIMNSICVYYRLTKEHDFVMQKSGFIFDAMKFVEYQKCHFKDCDAHRMRVASPNFDRVF